MVRAKAMFSNPVIVSKRLESWKMNPRSSRRNRASWRLFIPVMSRPPITMRPDVARSIVAMQLSSVVLPDPDGPMMATNSPDSTSKLTPASALVTASFDP